MDLADDASLRLADRVVSEKGKLKIYSDQINDYYWLLGFGYETILKCRENNFN